MYSRHSRGTSRYAATPQYLETVGRQGYRFRLGRVAPRLRPAEARPVVGRQGEWSGCGSAGCGRGGQRQFGVLSGEAGIGKTTVVDLLWPACPRHTRWDAGAGNVSTPTARGNRICRC